ncbi:MAG: hypothetical protein QOF78_3330 [Phycisphaerales bacterium]|nr:hypothetical protein [Phycisphaerales bacterium]
MGKPRSRFVVIQCLMLVAFAIAAATSPAPARAAVLTFTRTFEPSEIVIDRFGGAFSGPTTDTTRASIHGATSAGAGDEIHINLLMAPGSAIRFQPNGDFYFIEAMLWNNGGNVDVVGASDIAYAAATNIRNQAGTLDYETSNIPSWRASKWATRAEFFTNPTQPGQFSQLNVTFTIPAGYPTVSFEEVYMNIGAQRNGSGGAAMMSVVVPEPASLALAMVAITAIARRRRW